MTRHFYRVLLQVAIFSIILGISGCSNLFTIFDHPTAIPTQMVTLSPTATLTPTATQIPIDTPTPTPRITPTSVWVYQPAGRIICPILLYHHISDPPTPGSGGSRYYVSPADFETQMQALSDWGYETIPISLLIDAITNGAELPPRPIVISFDDGDISVFTNAFPIMQRYGFKGVNYLIANRLNADGSLGASEVMVMHDAGWEVGSHSMTHVDLLQFLDRLSVEGYDSKIKLQKELGIPVETFAYPFGSADTPIMEHIYAYGYSAAVGLGTQYEHSPATLFYLSRIEIRNGTDITTLASMLPWPGLSETSGASTP